MLDKLIQLAHSWYPISCCSGEDCRPVPCEQLTELANGGYRWLDYIFTKDQVHSSLDQFCHVCISKLGTTYCVFIQQLS